MPKIKLKRTLYVGLGGTGVMSLLHVKKNFIDSYGEVPPMIAFLAIDTDNGSKNHSVTAAKGEQIKLEQNELCVCSVQNALETYRLNPTKYNWVPSPNVNALDYIMNSGAGQMRSNGRFIAVYNHQNISDNIQTKINQIHQDVDLESKYAVDLNDDNDEYHDYIHVFCSVAGGTGSGMLVDTLIIIQYALRQLAQRYMLFPWIFLPEVFRSMDTGPSMSNVRYNTYGALRDLDYIMNHQVTDAPINFGYTSQVDRPLFAFAYIVGKTNKAGTTFKTLDELLECTAKSAFLPSTEIGTVNNSKMDNIFAIRGNSPAYKIHNKEAWAVSSGAAELLWDSHAVGRTYACVIASSLCDLMLREDAVQGASDANGFVDNTNVQIRENDGRDDVIDYLLSAQPLYGPTIDKNTTSDDIELYLKQTSSEDVLRDELKKKLKEKLNVAREGFTQTIDGIMKRNACQVGGAINFIASLKDIIGKCRDEMIEEKENFHQQNQIPVNWNSKLDGIKKTSLFSNGIKSDAAQSLEQEVRMVTVNRRQEIRRAWAKQFYDEFEQVVDDELRKIQGLQSVLKEVRDTFSKAMNAELNSSEQASKFQIFLHAADVESAMEYKITEDEITDYCLHNNIKDWIGKDAHAVERNLWESANRSQKIKDVLNTDIDNILRGLGEDKVKAYIKRLKDLASPLWRYDVLGYASERQPMDLTYIVGVFNRQTSMLATDPTYNTSFDSNGRQASFATTCRPDRISLLVIEDMLPIYAISTFPTYEQDFKDKERAGNGVSCAISDLVINRMKAEHFNIYPTLPKNKSLETWVLGFIFGLIHNDKENKKYWLYSKEQGDPLEDYRYDLNPLRDVSFEMFKNQNLDNEVEEELNKMVERDGRQVYKNKIKEIQRERSYLKQYAQLSSSEKNQIKHPNFAGVRKLVEDEINLVTKGFES